MRAPALLSVFATVVLGSGAIAEPVKLLPPPSHAALAVTVSGPPDYVRVMNDVYIAEVGLSEREQRTLKVDADDSSLTYHLKTAYDSTVAVARLEHLTWNPPAYPGQVDFAQLQHVLDDARGQLNLADPDTKVQADLTEARGEVAQAQEAANKIATTPGD